MCRMVNTHRYDFNFSSLGFSFLTCKMEIIRLTCRTVERFQLEKYKVA